MKQRICLVIMVCAFALACGFIGGIEYGTITVKSGLTGTAVSLLVAAISGKVSGVIE